MSSAENGFRPTRPFGRRAADATAAAPAAGSNGNGSGAGEETSICPLHDAVMTRRTIRTGDSWYNHRAVRPGGTEYWC